MHGLRKLRVATLVLCSLALICMIGLLTACDDWFDDEIEPPTPTYTQSSASIPPPAATATPSVPRPDPVAAQVDKWALWVDGPHLRGANIYQRRVYPELDGPEFMGTEPVGPPYTQEDLNRLADLGANYVNVSHPGLFSEDPPYQLDPVIQDNLDRLLSMIAQADMFAVISFRTGPGRAEFSVCCLGDDWFDESYLNDQVWADEQAQNAWAEMWRYTAERYRNHPIVAGYDLMVEPNANEVWFDEWDPETYRRDQAATTYDWNRFYPQIVSAIREVDAKTPILVGGMGYSAVEWLPYLEPVDDPRIVYAVHQYAPHQYTHQAPGPLGRLKRSYPGQFDADYDGADDVVNRAWLEQTLSPIREFVETHDRPVAVNEFGVVRWEPGAAQFMDDEIEILETLGLNYALWAWEPSWEPWVEEVNGFNLLLGPDPRNHAEIPSNKLLEVVKKYWARNVLRPSTLAQESPGPTPTPQPAASPDNVLDRVSHWLYLIDVNLEPEVVDQIAASSYDMVVLDFILSEQENTSYPMARVIEQLHSTGHPKLVLAYIDIGEAESYRTYWQPGWRVGDPEWIVGEDPDGWAENYPVAYWAGAWREIWLAEDGLLQQLLEAGFDGVYLDWVEAYSDENVVQAAEDDGIDPVAEMIRFVGDIRATVHRHCSSTSCIVIGQNAAELAERDDYLAVVDAIAQEQVWFDGGADNDPPGDCPLPRTDDDVDSKTYRDALSRECRRTYDRYPESTLHVSSEEYLRYLLLAQAKGVPILTVDYALEPDNVAWVYTTSRALGFVPFVSNRALDRYVAPVP